MVQSSNHDAEYDQKTQWFQDFEPKLPSLEGKTIAITGCTSGTGFIVARTCIKKNATNVLLLNRKSSRSDRAEEDLKKFAKESGFTTSNIETIICDLQDFASVREAASTIKSKFDAIDVLCNNAGVMALEDYATKDGYDVQMQTNHLSHFLLTKELFPLLQQAEKVRGEARIVHHTSGARRTPSTPLKAEYLEANGGDLGGNGSSMFCGGARWERYHQSKLANSVFTNALKQKLVGTNIKASVAAPGLAATNLQTTTGKAGGMGSGSWFMQFAQSAEDGTMPLLAACFDPSTENGDLWEPANRYSTQGPPTKVPYDNLTASQDAVELIWEKSEEACGVFKIGA